MAYMKKEQDAIYSKNKKTLGNYLRNSPIKGLENEVSDISQKVK